MGFALVALIVLGVLRYMVFTRVRARTEGGSSAQAQDLAAQSLAGRMQSILVLHPANEVKELSLLSWSWNPNLWVWHADEPVRALGSGNTKRLAVPIQCTTLLHPILLICCLLLQVVYGRKMDVQPKAEPPDRAKKAKADAGSPKPLEVELV